MDPAAPLIEALTEHGEELRRVARSVGESAGSVDDVLQETFLAAWGRKPRRSGRMRGWLRGIARNIGRRRQRTERRLQARERRAARGEKIPGPDQVVARLELRRRVLAAISRLDEPYRSAVYLRFFEELKPRQIASRLDVPVETVRTRVRRGIERLRRDLESDRGPRWWMALVPLHFGLWDKPSGLLAAGGAVVKKTAVSLVLIAAIGAVAWTTWPDGTSDRVHVGSEAEATRAAEHRGEEAPKLVGRDGAKPGGLGSSADERPSAPPATHEVRVRLHVDGALAQGKTGIEVRSRVRGRKQPTPIKQEMDETEGSLDVSALFASGAKVESLTITVDHPEYVPVTARWNSNGEVMVVRGATVEDMRVQFVPGRTAAGPARFDVDATLRLAAHVRGLVLGPDGVPVPAASLSIVQTEGDHPRFGGPRAATTDVRGRYALRLGRTGPHAVLAVTRDLRPGFVRFTAVAGQVTDVEPIRLEPGELADVEVLLSGRSAPGAQVVALNQPRNMSRGTSWSRLGEFELIWNGTRFDHHIVRGTTDAQGRVRLRGLCRGNHRIGVTKLEGAAASHLSYFEYAGVNVEVPSGRTRLDLTPARVEVDVLRGDKPIEGALVTLTKGKKGDRPVYGMMAHTVGRAMLRTDAEGRASWHVAPETLYVVKVAVRDGTPIEREVMSPAAGSNLVEQVQLEISMEDAKTTLIVRLETRPKETIPRALFILTTRAGHSARRSRVRGEENVFTLRGVPHGPVTLLASPGGNRTLEPRWWPNVTKEIEIARGQTNHITIKLKMGGRLRVAARDPDGRLIAARCTIRDQAGKERFAAFVSHDVNGRRTMSVLLFTRAPSMLMDVLEPGRYTIECKPKGYRKEETTFTIEPGKFLDLELKLTPN